MNKDINEQEIFKQDNVNKINQLINYLNEQLIKIKKSNNYELNNEILLTIKTLKRAAFELEYTFLAYAAKNINYDSLLKSEQESTKSAVNDEAEKEQDKQELNKFVNYSDNPNYGPFRKVIINIMQNNDINPKEIQRELAVFLAQEYDHSETSEDISLAYIAPDYQNAFIKHMDNYVKTRKNKK